MVRPPCLARQLATCFQVGKDTIQRILARPMCARIGWNRYMVGDDPHFDTKAANVIGLYLAPP
jgi:hypothetical protein